jgi:hypothetical protein
MEIRRLLIVKDVVNAEGGLPAARAVTRIAVGAVISNPLAGSASEDVSALVPLGALLGERLAHEALQLLDKPVVSYGKGAIVGNQEMLSMEQLSFTRRWASRCVPQLAAARP